MSVASAAEIGCRGRNHHGPRCRRYCVDAPEGPVLNVATCYLITARLLNDGRLPDDFDPFDVAALRELAAPMLGCLDIVPPWPAGGVEELREHRLA